MIGSHNTMTCYSPKMFIMRAFTWLWRCQDLDFTEQLKKVDYYDIRVRYNRQRKLVFCHGLVDLDVPYSLEGVLDAIYASGHKCRLILERGEDYGIVDRIIFENRRNHDYLTSIDCIVIKKGWKVLYGKGSYCKDYTYIPFYSDRSFWDNIKHLKISYPRLWAKEHNPKNQEMLRGDSTIHFMDFVE